MKVLVVTGSMGLVGSATILQMADQFDHIVGVDNDARQAFFGAEASGSKNLEVLHERVPHYRHVDVDIRNQELLSRLFNELGADVSLVVHSAAQPSHDYAAQDPALDFSTNALATHYLLECTRKFCPEAVFIFTSTNKVYGDLPNDLPLVELEYSFELKPDHPYHDYGIDESMSIDQSTHSLFGVSKVSADL
ncbi:MAG: GDP-mannose 4,6-dehydratase, partial [Saprospiraceae bacterium]|nr:GDP-mannose 4,6-dehydratase [Saprospiraceae bacterium]